MVWGEAERAGSIQPGEEKSWGWWCSLMCSWCQGAKEMELDPSQWCRMRGNWHRVTPRKFWVFFSWRGGQTLEHVAQ